MFDRIVSDVPIYGHGARCDSVYSPAMPRWVSNTFVWHTLGHSFDTDAAFSLIFTDPYVRV